MILGILSILSIVLWGGLFITDLWWRWRVVPYLLSHAALYASVFVYGIENHNGLYAVAVIALTVLAVVWYAVRNKVYHSAFVWCGVSSLVLGLYMVLFYYVLPSAVSIVDLAH